MSDLWSNLTGLQQTCLTAIYEVDQDQEQKEREHFSQEGRMRPSSAWRWIDYASVAGKNTSLKAKIGHLGLQQTEITTMFEGLQQKDLILWKYAHTDRNGIPMQGEAIITVQITRAGRKLIRQIPGYQPKLRPLTENQQAFADRIVEAGLAPREEVEAAFRGKSVKGRERIRAWGRKLSQQLHQQQEGLMPQGNVTTTKKKQPLSLPKGTDNPYRATQYDWIATEELLHLLPFWNFSVRKFSQVNCEWTEEARCLSRESAYQITKALSAQQPLGYFVVIQCMKIGKQGREKPVLFAPSEGAVEFAMQEATREKKGAL